MKNLVAQPCNAFVAIGLYALIVPFLDMGRA